jgi:putative transposase
MQLNRFGEIVEASWFDIPNHCAYAELDAFVVMPNHIHGIVCIERAGVFEKADQNLSEIILGFKPTSARRINDARQTRGTPVWQRSFYDHIIRGERDLIRARDYIAANPSNWPYDEGNPHRRRRVW